VPPISRTFLGGVEEEVLKKELPITWASLQQSRD